MLEEEEEQEEKSDVEQKSIIDTHTHMIKEELKDNNHHIIGDR